MSIECYENTISRGISCIQKYFNCVLVKLFMQRNSFGYATWIKGELQADMRNII